MYVSSRTMRQRRPAVSPATAAAVLAVAALALLAAACTGGGPSPSAGSGASPGATGSPSATSAVAYSACMRSHGVPTFPDPGANGQLPKTSAKQLGVGGSRFSAAQAACQPLLPDSAGSFDDQVRACYLAGDCPPALLQQMSGVGLRFARYMRGHGVPNWPDPTLDGQGHPYFDISGHGITSSEWHSSGMRAKADECARVAGGGLATG